MRSKLRRYVYVLHRWFGIGMCLLVALWFASGIIMMYVEYPELTEVERLDNLRPIRFDEIALDAEPAVGALGAERAALSAMRLTTVLGRPAYQLTLRDGRLRTLFADDGAWLEGITSEQAEQAVRESGFGDGGAAPQHVAKLEMDQWTVSAVLSPFRPLHKVELGDAGGTVVYVSDVSGQIVRDTNRRERFWNWLGSTVHWIYPWQLRRNVELWTNVIIVLSLAGLVSILTGAIAGWWRLRLKQRYRRGITPFRGMHKWHHLLGLGSLLFLATFMFSGLMSMGPWGIFSNATPAAAAIERYTGGQPGELATFPALGALTLEPDVKEVEWVRLRDEPYLVASRSATERSVIGAEGELSPAGLRARVERALPALLPEARVVHTELISGYDDYYYSHHNRYRPLPVLRVRFADFEHSWFHIDLDTGQIVNRMTRTDRLARWLFNGLHSLDFAWLLQRRPLWDLVVILLCVVGFAFSLTSVWIGWRRLRHRAHVGMEVSRFLSRRHPGSVKDLNDCVRAAQPREQTKKTRPKPLPQGVAPTQR